MRLVITTEHRFFRTPDGVYWTTSAFAYPFWLRYLEVFERLRVVARACLVQEPPPNSVRSDGDSVEFYPVPYFLGPGQFLLRALRIYTALERAVTNDDAVIMRIGSPIATLLEIPLRRQRHPYGVEVVGDPYEVFAPGGVNHPLRPLFRWWFTRAQKRQCWNATAAAYVTQHKLQRRYPCRGAEASISDVEISEVSFPKTSRGFQTYYSSVELTPESYLSGLHRHVEASRRVRLILVGSLEQYYKGPDVVIAALAQLCTTGHDLELVIVGDGKYRQELQRLAERLGVGDRVLFRGMLPAGQAVRDELDAADLFVLPSRTEGLPRAMIEAMARGLPCIGSTAGGIPELLPPEDMVPPGDVEALARKIQEVLAAPTRMQEMSRRNLDKAQEYHQDILRQRRYQFYSFIRRVTEEWLRRGAREGATCRQDL